MVTKKVSVLTDRDFCDVCGVEETYPPFKTCNICSKQLCQKCEILINPLNFIPVRVCPECMCQELEEIKKIGEELNKLQEQIETLYKKECEVVTRLRDKRLGV